MCVCVSEGVGGGGNCNHLGARQLVVFVSEEVGGFVVGVYYQGRALPRNTAAVCPSVGFETRVTVTGFLNMDIEADLIMPTT